MNEEAPGRGEEDPKDTAVRVMSNESFWRAAHPITVCSKMQEARPGMVALTCNLSIQEARR